MNTFFTLLVVSSIIAMAIYSPDVAFSSMLAGAENAITLALTLIAIYSIWLSVLKIMDNIGLNKIIYKIFKPITKALFKGENELALGYITLNFSANLLGMGGAATPLGIKAIEQMNNGSEVVTDNMALFVVINATSIQILPATIIGLRASAGSISPSNIIIPSLIATTIATLTGILLCYCFKMPHREPLYKTHE